MGIVVGEDGVARCGWPGMDAEYIRYHDEEWGRPVAEDRRLFEKLCLEGFQSGLSWLTILRKRENFRKAFKNFEIAKVARFGEKDVARLLQDAGIIRHRGKIEATINNAKAARELIEEKGSLAAFVWSFEETPPPAPKSMKDVPATTKASEAMARELKKRGFRFVGPTTAYAFLQSMGVVNDHMAGCAHREQCEVDRTAFKRPG